MNSVRVWAIGCLLLPATLVNALVIDSFNAEDGPLFRTDPGVSSSTSYDQPVFAARTMELEFKSGTGVNTLSSFNGLASYMSEPSVEGRASFIYSSEVPLDFSHLKTLELDFIGNDSLLHVSIRLGDSSNWFEGEVDLGDLPQTLSMGAWTSVGAPSWDNIRFLRIDIDAPAGANFDLAEVRAVPEPATMLVLGVGLAGLLRRRRSALVYRR